MSALRVIDIPEPAMGLALPGDLSFEQWEAEGVRLSKASHALQWYIGDWWNAGERFGEERRADTAKRFFGIDHGHVMNVGWVARKFDISCRHENLSFTHHQEAAALEGDEAAKVLDRAEQENWSVKDVRYVVQKLKASNDPEPGLVETGPSDPAPKEISVLSLQAQLTAAFEVVIEFAEALQQLRELTRRETDLLAEAMASVNDAHEGHRACPPDFDVIFVDKGRLECEKHFKASRLTVNRWMIERGKSRLVKERASMVRFQREQEYSKPAEAHITPIEDALLAVARAAASFLQISRYGGWRISQAPDGGWIVGTVHKSSDELIAMAERQGFDSEAARLEVDAE